MPIEPGLSAETKIIVKEEYTAAAALHDEKPPVLSTPYLIGLLENLAHQVVSPYLTDTQSSVGVAVNIRHMAATPVGMEVRAIARLIEVDGRKLKYSVEAWDQVEKIAEGEHERYIIDLDRFMKGVEKKVKGMLTH